MLDTSQISAFWRFIRRYFNDYGGAPAIVSSPFFIASLFMSAASYRTIENGTWTDTAISVIPNLLGFSLGTYALLFSLISPRIRRALRALHNARGVRYLDEMNATFLHFILVQVVCFLWAFAYKQTLIFDISRVIARHFPCDVDLFPVLAITGGMIGVSLIIYSILLVIGSSLTVYRIAKIVDPDPT